MIADQSESRGNEAVLQFPHSQSAKDPRRYAACLQVLEDVGVSKEQDFQELVQVAAALCGTTGSWISFFDATHQWCKAAHGIPLKRVKLEDSICFATTQQPSALIIEDLRKHEHSDDVATVSGVSPLRFYAGVSLRDPSGLPVGALSVVDTIPHRFGSLQQGYLQSLGRQAEALIRLRRQDRALNNALSANNTLVQSLSQMNDDLKQVLNAVPTIIIGLNSKGLIRYWNSAAERSFQIAASSACGHLLYDCGVSWIAERATLDVLHERSAVDDRSDHPFLLEGEKRWLGLTVREVQQCGVENQTTVLLSGADITDRRIQDEQTRQVHKMEAIGQLAAGIAHEINTPTQYVGDNIEFVQRSMTDVLATMERIKSLRSDYIDRCGETELLQTYDQFLDGWDSEFVLSEIPNALSQAFDGTRRIGSIVKAMKEFSHPGLAEKTVCDLNHSIDLTVLIARSEWKYTATLDTQLAPDLPQIMCYPGEINQVLLNLIVNATHAIQERALLDASAAPGQIFISTKQVDDWIEICIEDNGIGIPTEVQARVFELFFTTKDVGKGTGQGLAFAHSVIIKKHGGQLWFDSERFRGTSFYVRLPLTV